MQVLVITNADLKEELLTGPAASHLQPVFISSPANFTPGPAFDACIDLLFQNEPERIKWLNSLHVPVVVINSVITTLELIQQDFVRINGWNTFLKRPVIEAAATNDTIKTKAVELFSAFGKKTEWVPDIPGFLTARVIAAIINEAYFALDENVSTAEEIDTAMKLGTNYPWGPFEWSNKIGLSNILSLLEQLAKTQSRYRPSYLLQKTALI